MAQPMTEGFVERERFCQCRGGRGGVSYQTLDVAEVAERVGGIFLGRIDKENSNVIKAKLTVNRGRNL